MRHRPNTRLGPLLHDRLRGLLRTRGWPRTMALRRAVSVALVLLAGTLTFLPAVARDTGDAPVVVAGRDLAPGAVLAAGDITLRALPKGAAPSGALTTAGAAVGRVLAAPVRAGEPLTDVRIVGPADTALTAGDPNAAAVPVHLADPDVADLLHPGARVDVVTLDPERQADPVLAEDAIVITVHDQSAGQGGVAAVGQGQRGRLVVIALPRRSATLVAAASLRQPVTVTLR